MSGTQAVILRQAKRAAETHDKDRTMNQIIYIVGAIVIVIALLSFVGLR